MSFGFVFDGSPSNYTMFVGNGEIGPGVQLAVVNPTGYTSATPTIGTTTALIIWDWQSLAESSALGTYTITQAAHSSMLNVGDGKFYQCAQPILGVPQNASATNSPQCIVADSLITGGTYTDVITFAGNIGGTSCADWHTGPMARRLQVMSQRLRDLHLTSASGFTGDVWIINIGGEQDNFLGTARATLATCIRNWASDWASTTGSARYFVPTESISGIDGTTASATVTGAQADAVASGCTTCRQGPNVDSLTGLTNRQSGGPHLTQTGNSALAGLVTSVIQNCKATSC